MFKPHSFGMLNLKYFILNIKFSKCMPERCNDDDDNDTKGVFGNIKNLVNMV